MRAYYPVFFDGTLYVLDNGDEFTFTRPGYTFVGWNTKANGSGTWMDAGDELPYVEMDPPNVYNLYAQWKASVVTVTLDGNGGSFGGKANAIVTGETNDTLNLKDYAFLRGQQYTLAGWNTKADGSGKAYSVNDVYTLSDSITLYAQWKARSFTYDGAGCAAGDQVSFDITPADGTVQATLSVVSVKNNSPFDRMALAILAVYDGEGKMLAAEASELYITSEGVSGKLSVEYNADLVLNACQLFLLDGQSLEAMSDVIYTTFQ